MVLWISCLSPWWCFMVYVEYHLETDNFSILISYCSLGFVCMLYVQNGFTLLVTWNLNVAIEYGRHAGSHFIVWFLKGFVYDTITQLFRNSIESDNWESGITGWISYFVFEFIFHFHGCTLFQLLITGVFFHRTSVCYRKSKRRGVAMLDWPGIHHIWRSLTVATCQ